MASYRKTVTVGSSWVPLTITTAASERVMINMAHEGVVELVGMATAAAPGGPICVTYRFPSNHHLNPGPT